MHYRNLSAHFIQSIGKRKLSAGKVTVTVCLLLKNVLDKGYTLYSNRIAYSKSSFRKILFLFCHASLGIFFSEILLFFTQKSPTLFAKKGGKMKVFFNFLIFFIVFIPILSFLVLCLLFCPSPRAAPVSAKKFFFAPRLASKKMPKNPVSSVEYLRR